MSELKDRAEEWLEWYNQQYGSHETLAFKSEIKAKNLIKDQQTRITELEAVIENHLKYPLMGSKELKEALGK